MEIIKKFAKEISVFGLVLVIFLGLFIYRQATYATYTTISTSKLDTMVADKKDMILVVGESTDTSVVSYQEVLENFCTKNRKYKVYYVDKGTSYVKKKFDVATSVPVTLIIKDGKVKAYKAGALQYYYLLDFVKENY